MSNASFLKKLSEILSDKNVDIESHTRNHGLSSLEISLTNSDDGMIHHYSVFMNSEEELEIKHWEENN